MKKCKLISGLIGAGVLVTSTPILATSCNKDDNKVQDIVVYFGENAWVDADKKPIKPQVGVTAYLNVNDLTYSIPDINFSNTPVNTETIWANVGTMTKFGIDIITLDTVHLSITPYVDGKQSFNFRFTCYKDSNKTENGITYNVSGEIDILPAA